MNQSDNIPAGDGGQTDNSLKSELKQDASDLKDTAAAKASEKTNEALRNAASAAHSTSSALREAGDKLENDSDTPGWLGGAFKQAADSIAKFADTVGDKEPREMMDDVNRFARDNPVAFLVGSAMVGFAAARVMKVGSEQSDASHDTNREGNSGNGRRSTAGSEASRPSSKPTTSQPSASVTSPLTNAASGSPSVGKD